MASGSDPSADKLVLEYPEWSGCQPQSKWGVPSWLPVVVRRGPPPRTPRVGSCLTLGKELSEEKRADKARDFIGSRHQGGEQQGKVTQENCSAMWLPVSGFMVMG